MPIRSQKLISYRTHSGNASSFTFTCPAGYIILVKSAFWYNENATAAYCDLIFASADFSGNYYAVREQCQPQTNLEWNGWVALNPNDWVQLHAEADGVNMWLSGAILPGPPQLPAVAGP